MFVNLYTHRLYIKGITRKVKYKKCTLHLAFTVVRFVLVLCS